MPSRAAKHSRDPPSAARRSAISRSHTASSASVVIGYELFVRPLLQILSGVPEVSWEPFSNRARIRAKIGRRVASRSGREDYVRVALEQEGDDVLARPVLGKSGLITTLVHAGGTVIIPANRLGLEQGDEVDVWLFG